MNINALPNNIEKYMAFMLGNHLTFIDSFQFIGEYHDLYLISDILLFTDVFENFRKTCLRYYKLDPCHYFTSPDLSWDATLNMLDIKLELMVDIDM